MALLVAVLLGFAGYGIYLFTINKRTQAFSTIYLEAQVAPESEALKYWRELSAKNPPLDLEEVIAIQIGGILAKQSEWPQAASEFNKAADSSTPILKYVGAYAEAIALENGGNYQAAHDVYKTMAFEEKNPFKEFGRLGMARSLVALGKVGEGETILYQLLAKDSPAPPAIKSAAVNKLLAIKIKSLPHSEALQQIP